MADAARAFLKEEDADTAEALCYESLAFGSLEEILGHRGPLELLAELLESKGRAVELLSISEDLFHRIPTSAGRVRALEFVLALALGPARSPSLARHTLSEWVALDPDDWALCQHALAAARNAGDWRRALELLQCERDWAESRDPGSIPLIDWERAEVFRCHLDEPDRSVNLLKKAAAQATASPILRRTLHWHWLESGQRLQMIGALMDDLTDEADPLRVVRANLALGFAHELHQRNGATALSHFEAVLEVDPDNKSALLGVVRLAERTGRAANALPALEKLGADLEGAGRAALLHRCAEIHELALRDLTTAKKLYAELGETVFAESAALGRRICAAAEGLDTELYRNQEEASLAPAVERLLTKDESSDGGRTAAEADHPVVWASRIFRGPRSDGSPRWDAAGHLAEVLEDARSGADMLRLGLLANLFAGLTPNTKLLGRLSVFDPADALAPLVMEAGAAPGTKQEREAIDLHLRSVGSGLGRVDALCSLIRHFAVRDEDDKIWDVLERLTSELPEIADQFRSAIDVGTTDPEGAAGCLEGEARRTESKVGRTELLLRAARLRRRNTGQLDQAVQDLWAILREDPRCEQAFEELKDIYTAHGDHAGLYELLEVRHRHAKGKEEHVAVLDRMAKLAYDHLKDRTRAAWCHQQIVVTDPTQIRSYRILAEICTEEGDLTTAAQNLEEVFSRTDQETLRLKTGVDLANLYAQRLNRSDRAVDLYHTVLKEKPRHVDALKGLLQVSEARGDWSTAIDSLQQLTARASAHARTAILYLRLARAHESRGAKGDEEHIERALRRAVMLAPQNKKTTTMLAEFVRRTERWHAVEAIVKQVADGFGTGAPSNDEGVALRALFEVFEAAKLRARAYSVAAVLRHFGHHTTRTEMVRENWPVVVDGWQRLTVLPAERTACVFPLGLSGALVELLRLTNPHLLRLFPSRAKDWGASRKTRVLRTTVHPCHKLAELLSRPDVEVHSCLDTDTAPCVEPGPVPQLLLPVEFPVRRCSDLALWKAGFAMAPSVMGFDALARLPIEAWVDVVALIVRVSEPDFLRDEPAIGTDTQIAGQVATILPRKLRGELRRLTEPLKEYSYADLHRQRSLLRVAYGSLASLACHRIEEVLLGAVEVGGIVLARGLVPFLVSNERAELREEATGRSRRDGGV